MNQREALAEVRDGRIRPVYLIYGGEPFLEEELFRAIRDAIVRPETADFNFHTFHPGPDQIQQAIAVAQTQPFFADRRLVVVRDCPLFAPPRRKQEEEGGEERSGSDADLLLAYLKHPSPSTCLVFINSDSVDARKKATKAVVAAGGAVECRPLKPEEAVGWAQSRALVYGKKLGEPAARLLVEKVGADLRLIDSELQKLSLYVGSARTIAVEDVDRLVGGMAETEIYHLTDAVMLRERARALVLLDRILRQVDHPLQVVVALTNRFRQILAVKALVERRLPVQEGAALAKMKPFPYEKMAAHVRTYPRAAAVRAMQKLLEADLAIKSGADPRLTVEALVVDLMA